jgi:hypothetical protein
MASKVVILSILIFALLSLGAFKAYSLFYRPLVHHLNPDMQIIGIITLDNSHEVTKHSILNGDSMILGVDHSTLLYQKLLQKIPQLKYLALDEFFSVYNLHLLDSNLDGLITSKDPIFEHLCIIHFGSEGSKNNIKTLPAAGIKSIYINNTTPTGDHQVLMTDGSSRTLYGLTKFEKPEAD